MILTLDLAKEISYRASVWLAPRKHLHGVDHAIVCAIMRLRGEFSAPEQIELHVARSIYASQNDLARLALSEETPFRVRMNIALRDDIGDEILTALSVDESNFVRATVALKTTRRDLLEILANDASEWVRLEVARNWHTPELSLAKLRNDLNPGIRHAVYSNPSSFEAPYL